MDGQRGARERKAGKGSASASIDFWIVLVLRMLIGVFFTGFEVKLLLV